MYAFIPITHVKRHLTTLCRSFFNPQVAAATLLSTICPDMGPSGLPV